MCRGRPQPIEEAVKSGTLFGMILPSNDPMEGQLTIAWLKDNPDGVLVHQGTGRVLITDHQNMDLHQLELGRKGAMFTLFRSVNAVEVHHHVEVEIVERSFIGRGYCSRFVYLFDKSDRIIPRMGAVVFVERPDGLWYGVGTAKGTDAAGAIGKGQGPDPGPSFFAEHDPLDACIVTLHQIPQAG